MIFNNIKAIVFSVLLCVLSSGSFADKYTDTVNNFASTTAGQQLSSQAYGYAVFPIIGKGGIAIGGAYGTGKVFVNGQQTGKTSMSQLSIGFQLGGQAYSQIIYFENAQAYENFTKGNFEFSSAASAIAVTLSANAQAGTTGVGSAAGTSADQSRQRTVGFTLGMAILQAGIGGFMLEASIAGQKYSFTPQ